jgi:hypothetical protein
MLRFSIYVWSAAGEKWSKMYGPYLLYCNENEGGVEAVWENFPKELPNPLEYTIGKSNPATDWNVA